MSDTTEQNDQGAETEPADGATRASDQMAKPDDQDVKPEEQETTRTLVVNLYGGPGTGKSTTAAATFAYLSLRGKSVELSTEYSKDVVGESGDYLQADQIFMFAEQNRKLVRLYGKVDAVVTDSPLYLSYYYTQNEHILGLIQQEMKRADHLHVFLVRKMAYDTESRRQTEAEALDIDTGLRQMLDDEGILYHVVDADEEAASRIALLIEQHQSAVHSR